MLTNLRLKSSVRSLHLAAALLNPAKKSLRYWPEKKEEAKRALVAEAEKAEVAKVDPDADPPARRPRLEAMEEFADDTVEVAECAEAEVERYLVMQVCPL